MPPKTAVATTSPSTTIALKPVRPIDQFKAEIVQRRNMIAPMLPPAISQAKFEAAVIAAVGSNPKLLDCYRPSLIKACIEAAELGLSLNPALKEADILIRWNNKEKRNDAQFQPRYMGMMKLARQSGEIAKIYSRVVREGDAFDYEHGLDEKLYHKPAAKRGALTHVYCVWKTKDGESQFEVLDRDRVLHIRSKSSAKNRDGDIVGPWVSDEEEMWRKSSVRQSSKYMPMSADNFQKAVTIDGYREAGIEVSLQDGEVIIDEPIDITADAPTDHGTKATADLEARVTATARKPAAKITVTLPMLSDDGETDWASWAKTVCPIIAGLEIGTIAAWETAHREQLNDVEFADADACEAVRAALAARS